MRVGEAGEVLLGRQRSPKYQSGRFTRPYLRVANVFDNNLDLSDVLEMDFDERDAERFGLEVGDILLNEGQSRELVGRCAMYNGEIPGCCFQNTLVRFRAGQSVLPRFALYYFQHAFHTGVFAAIASQTTAIAHLGAGRFANLLMPVPPLTEQEVIVARLDQIEANHTAMIQHFGRVRQLAASIREHFIAGRTR
jgi:type I restriction enzyme S subunit